MSLKVADHEPFSKPFLNLPDRGFNEPEGKDHVCEPEPDLESNKAIGIVNYFRKKVFGLIGKN